MEANENVELSGFRNIDSSAMDVVKKIVSNHSKKIRSMCSDLQNIHVVLKEVHKREKSEIYDIQVRVLDNGKIYASEAEDRNLLAAVDSALLKIMHEID